MLILTVNPDAGRSSPTTFRPDALYEFVVASNGGSSEDLAFRVTFTDPDETGRQQVGVRRAIGPAAGHGTEGTLLGEDRTGAVFPLDGNGLAWAGLAADPFSGDGIALGKFLQGLSEGRYTPEVFTAAPGNIFAGRDVTAIALQLPDATLGGNRVALWGRISLHGDGHHPQRQVSRIGQPMLRPLFFNPPDEDVETLNAGAPATDRDNHGERVRRLATTVARLAGLSDPDGHAARVAAAFLPDALTYQPGRPAAFHPGDGNGRALGDDAFDIAIAVLAGSTLANASAPARPPRRFPTCPHRSRPTCPPSPSSFSGIRKEHDAMDQQPASYRIRRARPDEVPRLRQIEDEAGTIFSGLGLIDEALDMSFPLEELARLVDMGQVWVACPQGGPPVGMVVASVREGATYVEEMDVLPAHGRRGLGGRLLATVCAWAQAQGCAAVTLSTFRDVPWNGPFYRKHGFRDLRPAQWTPGMRAIREQEARHGLRVQARVFMRRELGEADLPPEAVERVAR